MYQFKKINDDEYILISKDKQFPFKRTVELAKMIQDVDLKSTIKLAEVLAERGETMENTRLRVERKSGNETIIDESNLRMIQNKLKEIAITEMLEEVYQKLFNKSILELLSELELNDDEAKKFSSELLNILIKGQDNSPRNDNTQGDREGI